MGDFPSLGEPCPAPADRRYADRFSKGGSALGTAKREAGLGGGAAPYPKLRPLTCAGPFQSCSGSFIVLDLRSYLVIW